LRGINCPSRPGSSRRCNMAKQKKNIDELRSLSVPELKDKLLTARKSLLEMRMKRAEQKNPLKLRWVRRDIARILTFINQKSTGGTVEKSN
jgi:ribosomal protein L29